MHEGKELIESDDLLELCCNQTPVGFYYRHTHTNTYVFNDIK